MSEQDFYRVEVDLVTPVLEQLAVMKAAGYPIDAEFFAPDTRYLPGESSVPSPPGSAAMVEMMIRYACPKRGEPLRYANLREALAFWKAHPERICQRMLIVRGDRFTDRTGKGFTHQRFSGPVNPAFESIGDAVQLNLTDAQSWWDDPCELLVKT